ncbi:MAG: mechanosensitive ion channel [Gammaproteobacteria bacterium]
MNYLINILQTCSPAANVLTATGKRSAVILAVILLQFSSAVAQAPAIDNLKAQLNEIDKTYKADDKSLSNAEINKALKEVATLKNKVENTAAELKAEVQTLEDQLQSLGEPSKAESQEVSTKRQSLKKDREQKEALHAQYKLLSIQLDQRRDQYQELRQTMFKKRLLSRGPVVSELLQPIFTQDDNPFIVVVEFVVEHHGLDVFTLYDTVALLVWLVIAITVSLWSRKKLLARASRQSWENRPIDLFLETFIRTLARFSPRLLISLVLAVFVINLAPEDQSYTFSEILLVALPIYIVLRFATELILAPKKPARRVLSIDDTVAKLLARWIRIFINLAVIMGILVAIVQVQAPGEDAVLLVRDITAIILIPLMLKILLVAAKLPQLFRFNAVRVAVMMLLVISLVIQLMGYRNLTFQTLRIVGSLILLYGAARFLQWLGGEFVRVINDGERSLGLTIRKTLGIQRENDIPGLIGISFLANLSLWVVFLFIAIRMFGFSEDVILYVQSWFTEGFTVGSLTVNPIRILFAIVLFAMLYTASGYLKASLDRKWISRTNMEPGARETIITIVGYVGVSIAIIIALGIAGVTFTNLAIIAGALSVGIGFGLQNIVNNFVSGLILLFERPIKKGDWVIVGSTEGYVKNIRIRSTQIQTFDRADIIVPNSDLISQQVTNWMLYDKSGRIRAPVGVAYGSDVEKVRDILLAVANDHPEVIKDDPDRPIRVFFLGFGDSSLDFDLRCHILTIDSRLTVTSDINFEIDKRFRENDIEIPFPQRDIHVRSTVAGNLPETENQQ